MDLFRRFPPIDVRWASAMLTLIILSSMHVYEQFSVRQQRFGQTPLPRMQQKLILSWTNFFQSRGPFLTPSGDWLKNRCGGGSLGCHVTSNRKMEDVSDAVLFHWRDVNLKDLPQKHSRQRWVLLNFESPYHVRSAVLEDLGPWIDWTATYRLDSDVQAPYGRVRLRTDADGPAPTDPPYGEQKDFEGKLLISWMVSNCQTPSHRENIVEELRKHLDVDIYGRCDGNISFLDINRDQSYGQLARSYKFYLSFENSVCRDYATEKVFQPLYHGLVPVVYGGADYRRILPPRSYIDILDFDRVQDLAEHLLEVGSNWTLYSSYHQWRKEYVVEQRDCENYFFCQLCSRLHQEGFGWNMDSSRSDQSLAVWWNKKRDCANVTESHLQRLKLLRDRRRVWFGTT